MLQLNAEPLPATTPLVGVSGCRNVRQLRCIQRAKLEAGFSSGVGNFQDYFAGQSLLSAQNRNDTGPWAIRCLEKLL